MTHTEIAIEGLLRPLQTMADLVERGAMTVDSARAVYEAAEPTEAWAVSAGADYEAVKQAWVDAWSMFEAPEGETAYLCLKCRKVTEDYAGDPSTGGLGSLCCNAKVDLITLGYFDRQLHGRSLRSELETDTMIQAYLTEKIPLTLKEVTLDDFTRETLEDDLRRHRPFKLMLRESDRRRDQLIIHSAFAPRITREADEVWSGGVNLKARE